MNSNYSKYLKYKNKYLELKKQFGGAQRVPNYNNEIDINVQEFLELPQVLPNIRYFDSTDRMYPDSELTPSAAREESVPGEDITLIFRKQNRYFAKLGGYYVDVSRIIDHGINNRIIQGNLDIADNLEVKEYVGSFFLTNARNTVPHLNRQRFREIIGPDVLIQDNQQ